MDQMIFILMNVGIIMIALMALGFVLARLYKRSSKEVSFVRTGFRGQKVIMNGGAIVLPVLHEVIPVKHEYPPSRGEAGESAGAHYPRPDAR